MCNAIWAFAFVGLFYKNLKGFYLVKTSTEEVPMNACVGIAFVTDDYSFHSAFKLAAECCESAKKSAKEEKNLRNGFAGNWMDYHIAEGSSLQELDMMRERFYVTGEQLSLVCRPYCLDVEATGQWNDYRLLMRRVSSLRKLSLTTDRKSMLIQSYMSGAREFWHRIALLGRTDHDMVEMLGEPLCKDNEGIEHAAWYDAMEVADLVLENRRECRCWV